MSFKKRNLTLKYVFLRFMVLNFLFYVIVYGLPMGIFGNDFCDFMYLNGFHFSLFFFYDYVAYSLTK